MKILSHDQSQSYQNSAFLRGNIVFTSLVQEQQNLLFFDAHLDRLLKGADFLFPKLDWPAQRERICKAVSQELHGDYNHYLRLTIFDDVLFMQKKPREFSAPEVKLGKALRTLTPGLKPDFLKLSNYSEMDLELRAAKEIGFDDVLFFDTQQLAAEATSSNIFAVTSDGRIKTPPTSSYVLKGIIREKLLECLRKRGLKVIEEAISLTDLEGAKEIWLTNAVKGVRFVSQFQRWSYERGNAVYDEAVKCFGRYGENYE